LNGIHKVKEDAALLERLVGDRPDVLNLLKKNMGKDIFVQKGGPTCGAYLPDCTFIPNLKYDVLKVNKYESVYVYD